MLGVQLSNVYQKLLPVLRSHEFNQTVYIFALINPIVYSNEFKHFGSLLPSQNSLLDLMSSFLVLLSKQSGQPQVDL